MKFYDEIRSNEDFWKDASNALKTDIPKLKQKGEECFGEFLAKHLFKATLAEVQDHLFNWLRVALVKDMIIANGKSKKEKRAGQTTANTDKLKADGLDSRRGSYPTPPETSGVSKRRFVSKN